MFSTYLKLGLRNLRREKSYSLINVAGLSIGVACCIILGLYIANQLSFDKHNLKHDRVYRVVNELELNGNFDFAAATSTQLAPLLKEQFPEVIDAVRFQPTPQPRYLLRSSDDQAYYWEDLYLADNSVFNIFTHEIIYGDPATALIDPSSMAVSESLARRYFGDRNPIGETLRTDVNEYRIDLVFADLPANSHLKYNALLSYNRLPVPEGRARSMALWNINLYTYVLMPEGYDPANFDSISQRFYDDNMAATAQQLNIDANMKFILEPLAGIHLTSTTSYDQPRGNILYVYAFAAVALFILTVAAINYMNLAIARSTKRAREVGMRKVIGASQWQLISQFLSESVFFTLLSLLLGVMLAWLILTFSNINVVLDAPLTLAPLLTPEMTLAMVVAALLLGVVSGLYPAFYLSAIQPVAAFRGSPSGRKRGVGVRQVLVMLQFVISVSVIACTLLMLAQMQYVRSKDLGFERENKLVVRVVGADQVERLPALMNELKQLPGVLGVATTQHLPGQQPGLIAIQVEDNNGVLDQQTLSLMITQPGFVDVMGLHLIEGRDFDESRPADVNHSMIVNESLVKAMGWDQSVGKRLQTFAEATDEIDGSNVVVGVVKDFNFQGLQHEVVPLAMAYWVQDTGKMSQQDRGTFSTQLIINVAQGSVQRVVDTLKDRWPGFDPSHPFEFAFLEDSLNELYGAEQRLMQLIGLFAAVCVFISCLGLYGLSAFNTAQRTREIGIRKVMGASTAGIILLLFRSVVWLVAGAAIIASGMSFWAISRWLQGFYYRIDLLGVNLVYFLIAAALAVSVAFVTMAMQSFRTAQATPVKALRYE